MTGNWDCIKREILEDTSFSLEEFRILLYLAAKPPGWEIHQHQLMQQLKIGKHRVERSIAGLRRRGFLINGELHCEGNRGLHRDPSILDRDKVIYRYPGIRDIENPQSSIDTPESGASSAPEKPETGKTPGQLDPPDLGAPSIGAPTAGAILDEESRGDKPLDDKSLEPREVDLGISPPEAIRSVDTESTDDLEPSPLDDNPRSPADAGSSAKGFRTSVADDSGDDFDLRRSPVNNRISEADPAQSAERPAKHPVSVVANASDELEVKFIASGCQWDKPCGDCDMCLSHRQHRNLMPSFRKNVYRSCVWCQDPKAIEFASRWSVSQDDDCDD